MIAPQTYQSFTVLNHNNFVSIESILKMGKLKYEEMVFSIRSNIVMESRNVFKVLFYVDTDVALPMTNLVVTES